MQRVDYYCKLNPQSPTLLPDGSEKLGAQKRIHPTAYFLDFFTYARAFDESLRYSLCPGDVNYYPEQPSIVKSRPIADTATSANAVLFKMDKLRHFIFINDHTPWEDKMNKVIFRGAIGQKDGVEYKKNRYDFMEKFFNHPMCDAGEVAGKAVCVKEEWMKPGLSIAEHMKYKFIMSLEGNDVASNLKWVMSSNSIAVMPKPTYEIWFMEGKLIPDYHYIEIKPDYSDMIEKLQYYIDHPDKANEIIRHAHEYVEQFKNSQREDIISLLVLDKYFKCTNEQ